jgi:hypothetical protein
MKKQKTENGFQPYQLALLTEIKVKNRNKILINQHDVIYFFNFLFVQGYLLSIRVPHIFNLILLLFIAI